jgi:hypothetical protein
MFHSTRHYLSTPLSTYIGLFIALNLLFVKKILIVTIEANFTSPLAGLKNAIKTDQNLPGLKVAGVEVIAVTRGDLCQI